MAGRVVTWAIALLLAVGITLNGSAPAWAGPFELGIRAVEHQDYGAAVQAFTTAIAQDDHASAAYGNRCLIQLWGSQLTQRSPTARQQFDLTPTRLKPI
ncbi:MAG: hypothetical protein HC812_08430 [Leptolyngbya sp. RL_3_1]|nr:hypothetical protein [Leptolyngbya sp. RL_3_1]